jgi:hypothetical protein
LDYFFFLLADLALDAADFALVLALAAACFFSLLTCVDVFAAAGALTKANGTANTAALARTDSNFFIHDPFLQTF